MYLCLCEVEVSNISVLTAGGRDWLWWWLQFESVSLADVGSSAPSTLAAYRNQNIFVLTRVNLQTRKNNYWLNCLIYRPHDHNITTLRLYNLRLSVSQPKTIWLTQIQNFDTAHQLTAKFCPLRPTRNTATQSDTRDRYMLLFFILFIYFLTSEQNRIMITKKDSCKMFSATNRLI